MASQLVSHSPFSKSEPADISMLERKQSNKLHSHLASLQNTGQLDASDLACSVCGQEPVEPRVSTKCHHLYCNTCFNKLRNDSKKGKGASHNIPCRHVGCESTVGMMSKIEGEWIGMLKVEYFEINKDQEGNEVLRAKTKEEDEMTDLE